MMLLRIGEEFCYVNFTRGTGFYSGILSLLSSSAGLESSSCDSMSRVSSLAMAKSLSSIMNDQNNYKNV